MTLQEIKDKVSNEVYQMNFNDLVWTQPDRELIEEIATRYARECVKASLEKAAEGFTRVAHDKITNESNIVLL